MIQESIAHHVGRRLRLHSHVSLPERAASHLSHSGARPARPPREVGSAGGGVMVAVLVDVAVGFGVDVAVAVAVFVAVAVG